MPLDSRWLRSEPKPQKRTWTPKPGYTLVPYEPEVGKGSDSDYGPFDPYGYGPQPDILGTEAQAKLQAPAWTPPQDNSTYGSFDPPGYRDDSSPPPMYQPPAEDRGWPGQISDFAQQKSQDLSNWLNPQRAAAGAQEASQNLAQNPVVQPLSQGDVRGAVGGYLGNYTLAGRSVVRQQRIQEAQAAGDQETVGRLSQEENEDWANAATMLVGEPQQQGGGIQRAMRAQKPPPAPPDSYAQALKRATDAGVNPQDADVYARRVAGPPETPRVPGPPEFEGAVPPSPPAAYSQEPAVSPYEHIVGSGYIEGASPETSVQLNAATGWREHPEGVPRAVTHENAVAALGLDEGAAAEAKWLAPESTTQLGQESEMLRTRMVGAQERVAELTQDITSLSGKDPSDVALPQKLAVAYRLRQVVEDSAVLSTRASRRLSEAMGRGLSQLQYRLSAQGAREVVDKVQGLAQEARKARTIVDSARSGRAGKVTADQLTELEGVAAATEANGHLLNPDHPDAASAQRAVQAARAKRSGEIQPSPERAQTPAEQLGALEREHMAVHGDPAAQAEIQVRRDALLEQIQADAEARAQEMLARQGKADLSPEEAERAINQAIGSPTVSTLNSEALKAAQEAAGLDGLSPIQRIIQEIKQGERVAVTDDRAIVGYWMKIALDHPEDMGLRQAMHEAIDAVATHGLKGKRLAVQLQEQFSQKLTASYDRLVAGAQRRNAAAELADRKTIERVIDKLTVQDMTAEARDTMNQIIRFPEDNGFKSHFSTLLDDMRLTGERGAVQADRLAADLEKRSQTAYETLMAGVEKRNVKQVTGDMAASERNFDKLQAQALATEIREFIKAANLNPDLVALRDSFGQTRLAKLRDDLALVEHGGAERASALREQGQKAGILHLMQKQKVEDDLLDPMVKMLARIDPATIAADIRARYTAAWTPEQRWADPTGFLGAEAEAAIAKETERQIAVELGKVVKTIRQPRAIDYLMEYQFINMLSGIKTHATNIAGNTLNIAGRLYSVPLEVLGDKMLNRGDQATGGAAEIGAMMTPGMKTLGAHVAGGTVGYLAGGQVGDTPEDRQRNALIGGAAGLGLAHAGARRAGMNMDAFKAAGEVMRTGQRPDTFNRALETSNLGAIHREYLTEKFGRLGVVLHSITTRPLEAADVLLGSIAYESAVEQQAVRRAANLLRRGEYVGGLKQGMTLKQATGAVLANIWDHPEVVEKAGKIRDYTLLRGQGDSDTERKTVGALSALRNAPLDAGMGRQVVALLANMVVPFFNVPYNFAKQGLDRSVMTPIHLARVLMPKQTPVLGRIAERDPAARADLFARGAVGATALLTAELLWQSGNLTGSGPPPGSALHDLWAETHKVNSNKMPDGSWVSWDSTPWAIPFAIIANMHENLADAQAKAGRQGMSAGDTALTAAGGAAGGIKEGILSQTFMQSIRDVLSQNLNLPKFASGYTSRNIPLAGLVRTMAMVADGMERDIRSESGLEEFGNRLSAGIPGLRQRLPTSPDTRGNPKPNPSAGAAGLMPFRPGRAPNQNDPVIKAFTEAGVSPASGHPKTTSLPGILEPSQNTQTKLTPEQTKKYDQIFNAILTKLWSGLPENAKNDKDTLDKLMTNVREITGSAFQSVMTPEEIKRSTTFTIKGDPVQQDLALDAEADLHDLQRFPDYYNPLTGLSYDPANWARWDQERITKTRDGKPLSDATLGVILHAKQGGDFHRMESLLSPQYDDQRKLVAVVPKDPRYEAWNRWFGTFAGMSEPLYQNYLNGATPRYINPQTHQQSSVQASDSQDRWLLLWHKTPVTTQLHKDLQPRAKALIEAMDPAWAHTLLGIDKQELLGEVGVTQQRQALAAGTAP